MPRLPHDLEQELIQLKQENSLLRNELKVHSFLKEVMDELSVNESPLHYVYCPNSRLTLEYISDNVQDFLGFSSTEFLDKSEVVLYDFIEENQQECIKKEIVESISKRSSYVLHYRIKNKFGKFIWVTDIGHPKLDENGIITHIEGFIFQNQNRVNAIEKLEREVKNKEKLLQLIYHDLKSPIHNVAQLFDFLQDHLRSGEFQEALELGSLMDKTLSHTKQFINHLLDWSKLQLTGVHFSPTLIKLSNLSKELHKQLYTSGLSKKVYLVDDLEDNLSFYGDQYILLTVLRNLISNSIKFSEKDGRVVLRCFHEHNRVYFIIRDFGIGIPSEMLVRFNEQLPVKSRLGTDNEKGYGLGLKMCRELIARHDGEMIVKSEEQKGTEVTISIPYKSPYLVPIDEEYVITDEENKVEELYSSYY